jgi:hypothetical protein
MNWKDYIISDKEVLYMEEKELCWKMKKKHLLFTKKLLNT